MNILITGANGMLGEECVKILSKVHTIAACDLQDSLEYDGSGVYQKLDIVDQKIVKNIVDHIQPELIINCAAYTDVDGSEINRQTAWSINAGGVRNLLSAMPGSGCKLIHISSDYV
ncbi:MAG: sugar nucleotide-binding protein, partial [Candidatus Marinimicrobia bacterium]|nr:sugar nucleotide-binding protein [Candidatus Neomarinimicrobiota bacterium]